MRTPLTNVLVFSIGTMVTVPWMLVITLRTHKKGIMPLRPQKQVIFYYRNVIKFRFFFLPVLVPNESSGQLDIVAGVAPELAHGGSALFDHVQKHLGQLRILVQVDQVGETIVHFEGHPCFLNTSSKSLSAVRFTG